MKCNEVVEDLKGLKTKREKSEVKQCKVYWKRSVIKCSAVE